MKAIILGIFEDFETVCYKHLNDELGDVLQKYILNDAKLRNYKTISTMFYAVDNYDLVCLIGLGKVVEYDLDMHRKLIGAVTKGFKYDATMLIDSFIPEEADLLSYVQAASEAIHLAQYQHINYKKKDESAALQVRIELQSKSEIKETIERGQLLARSTNIARDLYNMPANKLTPTDLANSILKFSESHSLEIEVLEKADLVRIGMGGILAVNQGSVEAPKLIVVKYMNSSSDEVLALVGKGVTFDTGGYSLKTAASMYGAHGDLGGAATMFGAFCAIVEANLPVNIVLIIPSTDNVVSANALKPGDVMTQLNGVTVEINNTDAEGRLILADALVYAQQLGATQIINAATLTGAVVQALGNQITGIFTNNEEFIKEFIDASIKAGEAVWELPISKSIQAELKTSDVADLKNAPSGPGALIAGAFLKEFVEDKIPWIHLDIAGTALTFSSDLGPNGATGVMVRTIFNYVEAYAKKIEKSRRF